MAELSVLLRVMRVLRAESDQVEAYPAFLK